MYNGNLVRLVVLSVALAACLPAQSKPAVVSPGTASPPLSGTQPPSITEAREAQLAADTERLYQLAQELKVEMDKSTKDTLSLTVVKKAAEIEKLAHSVGERMKTR